MTFEIQRVHYMPKELAPQILYVSEEFDIAMHLCACNCGSVVKTPLGPTEWSVKEGESGPTLRPSVGSWQLPCQSHYLITRGEIVWCEKWSEVEIAAGRRGEERRRKAFYNDLDRKRGGGVRRLWRRLVIFLGK
jgi:Family of unknown function (DUF6527)